MEIRPEHPGEEQAVAALIDAAFASAEHSSGTEAEIVDRLRADGALTISLVAVDDERIVGHVAYSPVTIDGNDRGWFGLGPVAVDPRHQCYGIGRHLIERGLNELRVAGAAGCVVLGEPDYYGRFGFNADGRLTFPGPPPHYFQALAFGDDKPAGTISYHRAFG